MFYQYNQGSNLTADHIEELYFIAPIANLNSILESGLLSHKRANNRLPEHEDIANQGVQHIRSRKILERVSDKKEPRSIHRHVVLYINPHNAMMVNMIKDGKEICVLRVDKSILDRGDVIISDKNASVRDAVFFEKDAYELTPQMSSALTDPYSLNFQNMENHKQARQAEVLFPYEMHACYLRGVIVGSGLDWQTVTGHLGLQHVNLPVAVVPSLFFLGRHERIILNNPLTSNSVREQALLQCSSDADMEAAPYRRPALSASPREPQNFRSMRSVCAENRRGGV